MLKKYFFYCSIIFFIGIFFIGCSPLGGPPVVGPDKQSIGTIYGAAVGAGSGAITGFNTTAVYGPGGWVGAGIGSIFGMLSGIGIDVLEEDQLRRQEEEQSLREIAWAQDLLAEHYTRRLELYPNRDIFPADVFFDGDGKKLKYEGSILARELSHLTQNRMPWSRIVIAAYVTSSDPDSVYASYLTENRAREIALEFVRSGFEPRRIFTTSVTLAEPLVIDPYDSPGRYRQAIEIIPLDY